MSVRDVIGVELRTRFLATVDQAPFTPFSYDKGTKPNVLALSFGKGDFDSAVVGAFVRDSGKIDEFFKSDNNPSRDRESEEKFSGQLRGILRPHSSKPQTGRHCCVGV